jgi:cellulose synthase/poly-beta-1,6-N-acetylglucosamine synthase-like glycosyltransferase
MAKVLPFKPTSVAPAAQAAARPFLGDILVRSGKLAPDALEGALALQRGQDTQLGHILLVNGLISREALTQALADQVRLGRADLDANPPEPDLVAGVDPYLCLRLEAIPWRRRFGRRVIAIANPDQAAAAMAALRGPDDAVALAIAPADAIRRAIGRRFGARMIADAERRCPADMSCRDMLSPGFSRRKAAALGGLAGAVALAPMLALQLALACALVANLLTTGLRLFALVARGRIGPPATLGETPRLVEWRRLPAVSLLVPLKGEAAVAEQLLAALGRMEYPAPLLDIKLVLEAGDRATHDALTAAGPPPTVEIVTAPAGTIQTKPRAMNYALPFCRGEIVGIYDAEDVPDPGQIRAVVHHLMEAPERVACVQGYLDFYNAGDNWLSRCFTIDYAAWFRIVLHGVQRLGLPIPLGGTTVFFRRAALEAVGGWDAHNVTEDADLGIRLARFGYRTDMIPTTTEEEANAAGVGRWVRQRARWLKGYAITWAVHMRRPLRLWRELGPAGFLGFQLLILGSVIGSLAAPLLWTAGLAAVGFGAPFFEGAPAWAWWAATLCLVAGWAVNTSVAGVALVDAGRARMLPWVLLQPIYGMLGAVAAWRALAEIVHQPFHWHKTEHGRGRAPAQVP